MDNMWSSTVDALAKVEQRLSFENMTINQQLQYAQIQALLSISQELSKIHHEGINPEYQQF